MVGRPSKKPRNSGQMLSFSICTCPISMAWKPPARSCATPRFASKAVLIPLCCACCWSVCGDDGAAGQHADLDCGGRDRLAARLHWAERAGRDQAGAETVLGAGIRVSRAARDGHIEIDNNTAERALRAVALGRKNYL